MNARTDIDVAVDAWGKDRYDLAWGLQQATIDSQADALAKETALNAQLSGQVALDKDQIAALQAQLDALNPALVVALKDFGVANTAQPGVALWTKSGKFGGTDLTKTLYRMPANTSTKANVTSATTPWFMMMFGGGSASTVATDLDVGGFTLDGTPQPNGLLYHGVRFGWSKGAKFHNAAVWGSRGTGSSPPQETFASPWWHADGGVLTDITLDGRDKASLTPVAATLYGGTSCDSATIVRLKANYANAGFGLAVFLCRGTYDIRDSDFRYNRKAINIERHQGGTIRFTNCDFRSTKTVPYISQVSSEKTSTVVEYVDCQFDGDLCQVQTYGTAVGSGANAWTNGQKDSDIRRIDNGKVITDPAKFRLL